MSNKKMENGSVHLIITVILAVIIVVLLGYLLFNNLTKNSKQLNTVNNSKSINGQSSNVSKPENVSPNDVASDIVLTEVAYDKTMGTKFALKYPNTWKHKYENPNDEIMGLSDINTITSPDGTAVISLNIGKYSGLAGPCGGSTTPIEVLDTGAIENVPNTYFVYYVDTGTPYSFIGASVSGDPLGKMECSSYATGDYLLGIGDNIPSVVLSAKFSKNVDIKSENYRMAKQIIQSLYKKD